MLAVTRAPSTRKPRESLTRSVTRIALPVNRAGALTWSITSLCGAVTFATAMLGFCSVGISALTTAVGSETAPARAGEVRSRDLHADRLADVHEADRVGARGDAEALAVLTLGVAAKPLQPDRQRVRAAPRSQRRAQRSARPSRTPVTVGAAVAGGGERSLRLRACGRGGAVGVVGDVGARAAERRRSWPDGALRWSSAHSLAPAGVVPGTAVVACASSPSTRSREPGVGRLNGVEAAAWRRRCPRSDCRPRAPLPLVAHRDALVTGRSFRLS